MPNLYGPEKRPDVDSAPYNRMSSGIQGDLIFGIAPNVLSASFRPDRQPWVGCVPYFAVADIDAATKRAVALGARVDVPPTQIADRGWVCHLRDSEGNPIGMWQAPTDWQPDSWQQARDYDPMAGWVEPQNAPECPEESIPATWDAKTEQDIES